MRAMSNDERGRIGQKIVRKYQKQIDDIKSQHPRLDEQIEKKLDEEAVKALGVQKEVKEREALDAKIAELDAKRDAIEKAIEKKMPKEKSTYRNACPNPMTLCEAVRQMRDTIRPKVQKNNTTYKRILALETEMEDKLAQLEKCVSRDQIDGLI